MKTEKTAPSSGHPWRKLVLNEERALAKEIADKERLRAERARASLERIAAGVAQLEALEPVEHDAVADAALCTRVVAGASGPRRALAED